MSELTSPGETDEEPRPSPSEESSPEVDAARRERRRKIEALKQELVGGDLFTAAEVAEILDIHPRTVSEYIRSGALRAHQFGGGWKISESALRAFLREQTEPRSVASPAFPKEPPKREGVMPWRRGPRTGFYCSFCGKSQEQVRRIIAGPHVFICDECVGLCNEIIGEQPAAKAQKDGSAKRR